MRIFDKSLSPKRITAFGGLVTEVDRMDMYAEVSPDNQNVVYSRGAVGSRFGTSALTGTPLTAVGFITGLFTYISKDGVFHLMAFSSGDSAGGTAEGTLYYENPAGTFNLVSNTMGYTAGTPIYMFGDTHYGRAWMAFHDGIYGVSHPRKYDGTTLSRVGTERPGWTGVTALVAGTGTFSSGTHRVRITFETDAGFSTPPSKVGTFDTGGAAGTVARLDNLPVGPTGTVRRVVWVATVSDSAATDATGFVGTTHNYYTLRNTNWIIPDNTSTTWTIDGFTDAQITQGESMEAARLWTIAPIPPVAGMVFYKNRYFYYGALGTIQPEYTTADQMDNYTFESGVPPGTPYGWTSTSAGGALTAGVAGATGNVWRMTGSGAATVGGITQSGNGTHPFPMFEPGINYGVRIRVKRNNTLQAGTLRISSTINSVTTNFDTVFSNINETWVNRESTTAVITGHTNSGDAGPTPLKIELIGTPTSGGICDLDWIDFFDILNPKDGSKVYCTSIDSPETVDSETGFLNVSPNDGQVIHSAFVLRDNLYFVKDRSIYVTSDNGATEPSGWGVFKVDDNIGTSLPQGVGQGEGWVVIAARSGLYYFDGGLPQKISEEIQPDWDSINWPTPSGFGPKPLDVKVDVEAKRIYVGVCIGAATACTTTYVLDFAEGFGDPVTNNGIGRKWTKWTAGAVGNSIHIAERADGDRLLLFGDNGQGGIPTGAIRKYDTATVNDSGAAINSYYDTAPQGLAIPGVVYFGGMIAWVFGAGTLTVSRKIPDGTTTAIGTFTLASPATRQISLPQNDAYEGLTYRFQTNAVGASWELDGFTTFIKPHMFYRYR